MKNMARILSVFLVFFLAACGTLEANISDLRLDNNTVYFKNSEQLFTGRAVSYSQQGILVADYQVQDGKFNGHYLSYYDDGTPREASTMQDGFREGESKNWNEFGQLTQVNQFSQGKKNGLCVNYWSGGGKSLESYFENDIPSGTWRQWDVDGSLMKETVYVDGKELSSTGPGIKVDKNVPDLESLSQ